MSVTEKRYWVEGIKEGYLLTIAMLKENSKCRIDGGHDTDGYCFCEAIRLIQGRL
jgi:hypothetical protein